MLRAITGVDIANTVRMMRTRFAGAVALVEGEKDVRIYARMVANEHCRVVPGFGKANTIEAVTLLGAAGVTGVVGIVDRDFGAVLRAGPGSANVFETDAHDLELMIIGSPALEKVLDEFGSAAKIGTRNVREMLLSGAELIGCLRLLSLQRGLDLKFEGLSFGDFVDRTTMAVDANKLIKAVKDKSQKPKLDAKGLRKDLEALVGHHDPFDVCCGHDVVGILSVGLRKCIGSCSASEASHEALERSLRLAYEKSHFSVTPLYALMEAWSGQNSGFRIL